MPDTLKSIGVDEITRRLSGTRMPEDPRSVVVSHVDSRLPLEAVRKMAENLKAAAVLIPLIDRDGALKVLLTERSAALRHHAGQVSFPGGGMKDIDSDIAATGLREAEEEVGIQPSEVSIVGYLSTMLTVTGFAVTPIVGFVESQFDLRIDPAAVKEAFEVPLDYLLDTRNVVHSEREYEGVVYDTKTFYFDGHQIWGATASILLSFREQLLLAKKI